MNEKSISMKNGSDLSRIVLLMIVSILMLSLSVSSVSATSLRIPSDITYYGDKLMLIGGKTYSFNATYADYKETYFSIGLTSRYERGIVGLDWKKKSFIVEPKVSEIGKETVLKVTGVKVVNGKNYEEDIGQVAVIVVNECEGKGPIGGACMDTQKYYCGSPSSSSTLLTSSGCDSSYKSISSKYYVTSGNIKCCPANYGAPVQNSAKSRKIQIMKPGNFDDSIFAIFVRYSSWFGIVNDDKPYDANTEYAVGDVSIVVKSKTSAYTGTYTINSIDLSVGSGVKYVTLTKDFLSSFKYSSFRVEMAKFSGDNADYQICFNDDKCWKLTGTSSTFTDIPLSYTMYYQKGRTQRYYFDYKSISFPVKFAVTDENCKVELKLPQGCNELSIRTDKQTKVIKCSDPVKYDDVFKTGEKFLSVSGDGFFDTDLGYTCSPKDAASYYALDLSKMNPMKGTITIENIPALIKSHIRTFVIETRASSCPAIIPTGSPNVNGKLQKGSSYCTYLCSDYFADHEDNQNCYNYISYPYESDGKEKKYYYVDENIRFKFKVSTNDPAVFNQKNPEHTIENGIVKGKLGEQLTCYDLTDAVHPETISESLSDPAKTVYCNMYVPSGEYGHFVLGGPNKDYLEITSVVAPGVSGASDKPYQPTDSIPRGAGYTVNIRAKCVDGTFSITSTLDSAEKILFPAIPVESPMSLTLSVAAYDLGDLHESAFKTKWTGATLQKLNDFWSQSTGLTRSNNGVIEPLTFRMRYNVYALDYGVAASKECVIELTRYGASESGTFLWSRFDFEKNDETESIAISPDEISGSGACVQEGTAYLCKDHPTIKYTVKYKDMPEVQTFSYTATRTFRSTLSTSCSGCIDHVTPPAIPSYEDIKVSYSASSAYEDMLNFFDVKYEYDTSGGERAFTNGMSMPKGKTVTFKLIPKSGVVMKKTLSKQERTDSAISLDLDSLAWSNPDNAMVTARVFSESDYNALVAKNIRTFMVTSVYKGLTYSKEYDISTTAEVALSDKYKVELKRGSSYIAEKIIDAPFANPIVSSIASIISKFNDVKVTINNKGTSDISVVIDGTSYTGTAIAAGNKEEFSLVAGTSYTVTYTSGTKVKKDTIIVKNEPSSLDVNIDSMKDKVTYKCYMDAGPCMSSGLSISAPAFSGLKCDCPDMKECVVDKGCVLKLANDYVSLYESTAYVPVDKIVLNEDFRLFYSTDLGIRTGKSLVLEVTKDATAADPKVPVVESKSLKPGDRIVDTDFGGNCMFTQQEIFNGAFAAKAPKITKDCRTNAAANLLKDKLEPPIDSGNKFAIKSVELKSLTTGVYSATVISNPGKLLSSTTPCVITLNMKDSSRAEGDVWCAGNDAGQSCHVFVILNFMDGYATSFQIASAEVCRDSAKVELKPGCPSSKIFAPDGSEVLQSNIATKSLSANQLTLGLKSGMVFSSAIESGKAKGAEIAGPITFTEAEDGPSKASSNNFIKSGDCDFKISKYIAESSVAAAAAKCEKITFQFKNKDGGDVTFASSVLNSVAIVGDGMTCTATGCTSSPSNRYAVGLTYTLTFTLKDGFVFVEPDAGSANVKTMTTPALSQACDVVVEAAVKKSVTSLDKCDFVDDALNKFASMFTVSKNGDKCTISGGCLIASGKSDSVVIDISSKNADKIKKQFIDEFKGKTCTYTINKKYDALKVDPQPCSGNRFELTYTKEDKENNRVDLPAFQLEGKHNPNLAWKGENCNAAGIVFCCEFLGTPKGLFYKGTKCEGALNGVTNPNCIYGMFYDQASCTYDLSKYLSVSGSSLIQLKIPHSLVGGAVDMANPVVLSFPDILGTSNSRDITSGSFSSPDKTFACEETTIFAMVDKGVDAEDPGKGLLRYIQLRDGTYYFNTEKCSFDASDADRKICIPTPKPEKKSQSCADYAIKKPVCQEKDFQVEIKFNSASASANKNEVVISKSGATFSPDFCQGDAPIKDKCLLRSDKQKEVSGAYPCVGLLVPGAVTASEYCVDSMNLGVSFQKDGTKIKIVTARGKFKNIADGCANNQVCLLEESKLRETLPAVTPLKDCSVIMEESSIMLPLGCPAGKTETLGYFQVETTKPGDECVGDYDAIRIKSASGDDSGKKGYCCKPKKECSQYTDNGVHSLVDIKYKDVYCVENTVPASELLKNVPADKICCVRKSLCSGQGFGLVKKLDKDGQDQTSKLCESSITDVPGDDTQVCCKEKTCPGTWVPADKEKIWCEKKTPQQTGEDGKPVTSAQDGEIIVFMRKTLTDGKDIVCCQRKTDADSILASLDLHKIYQKGLEHSKEVCDDKVIQEIQTQDDINCDKEMNDGNAETMRIVGECENECEISLLREGKLKYPDLDKVKKSRYKTAEEYAMLEYYPSLKESCVKKCHRSKSACAKLDKNKPQIAKEACEKAIQGDNQHEYNGKLMSECIVNEASTEWFPAGWNSYCNGVREGIQEFRRSQRQKSALAKFVLDSGDTSTADAWIKLIGRVAGLFGGSLGDVTDVNSLYEHDFGSGSMKSFVTPFNNIFMGFRNMSPSVQLNNFCEGKGFYGANWEYPGTRSDSNSLVNLLVSRQRYVDCDENGANGKETCSEVGNLSKYIYLFTWQIGGFEENVSYNIWLTNSNSDDSIEQADYCFKQFNVSDYNPSGNLKSQYRQNCWSLVLVKGDSHTAKDTLVARFLNTDYSYACVKYRNYESGDKISLPENDDYQNMWSSWYSSSLGSMFGQTQSGNSNDNSFVCVQINNNGLGVEEEGDMMGDPYAVYSQTDQDNPDDASDDGEDGSGSTATTTTGIR